MAQEIDPPTLSLTSDYISRLVVKVRGIQSREDITDPDSGSNPTDDNAADMLQDGVGDLSRMEVLKELAGLNEQQQAELVALMWVGRGDAEPEEWEETVQLAKDLKEQPTPRYLIGHPLLAEHWDEGAEKIGIDLFTED